MELKVDVLNRSSIEARRPGDAARRRLDRAQVREMS